MTDSADPALSEAHRDLLARFHDGQRAALARVISIVENQREGFHALLHALHPRIQGSRLIGVTGPPGAGKSTITASLIERFRERGETVGVIAVDPTSPYTGGALLGDRIRMGEVAQGEGVFIRSMATRGALGGIAAATREAMDVLAAFGFDVVIVETVGVGQSELDIAAAADTTAVVLVPESGDAIQTMKAGLMEAADLFVVNKADRPGAQRLAKEVEMMLHLRLGDARQNVPAHHGVQLNRADTARAKMAARARLAGSQEAAPADRPGGEAVSDSGDRSTMNDIDGAEKAANASAATRSGPVAPSGDRSNMNDPAKREDQPSRDAGRGSGGPAPDPKPDPARDPAHDPGPSPRPSPDPSPGPSPGPWAIPVLLTSAEKDEGMDELVERLDAHAEWLGASGELERRRRGRLEERVRDAVRQRLLALAWQESDGQAIMDEAMDVLMAGETTPYEVADRIVDRARG